MNEYTEFDTAAEMQKALDRKKAAYGDLNTSLVEFTDGTTAPVVDGLIGLTEDEEEAMAVNSLIAKDERPSFQPSTAELAMFLIFFFLCLGLSLHTVMRGDKAAMRGMALPRVESGVRGVYEQGNQIPRVERTRTANVARHSLACSAQ